MVLVRRQHQDAPLLTGGRWFRYVVVKTSRKENIKVEPLGYSEASKAAREALDAIWSDSMYRYFRGGDHTPFFAIRERLQLHTTFSNAARRRRILTVDHGNAICYYVPGDKEGHMKPWLKRTMRWTQPAELSKRKNEFSETAQRLARSAFGGQLADMIEIRGLAVSTKRQRRGYGAALVEAIHRIADEQARAVWLVTSDAVGFYEAVGYTKVREEWIGARNPAWDGPPVPVRIMMRRPQPIREYREKAPRH